MIRGMKCTTKNKTYREKSTGVSPYTVDTPVFYTNILEKYTYNLGDNRYV